MELIPLDQCQSGRLYKLECRNFSLGVFDGDRGFIGIRLKFRSRFLDTEYHWDADPRFGTVSKMEDTGIDLPEGIVLSESTGCYDQKTGRPVVIEEERGWCFTDTDEASKDIWAVRRENSALFDWLNKQECERED